MQQGLYEHGPVSSWYFVLSPPLLPNVAPIFPSPLPVLLLFLRRRQITFAPLSFPTWNTKKQTDIFGDEDTLSQRVLGSHLHSSPWRFTTSYSFWSYTISVFVFLFFPIRRRRPPPPTFRQFIVPCFETTYNTSPLPMMTTFMHHSYSNDDNKHHLCFQRQDRKLYPKHKNNLN